MLSHRQILAILAGLMAGTFLAALDQTVVANSVRTMADDLNGLTLQASVTTAYLITSTVTTPLYGKLSDLYGRKPLFLFAISMFMVGSLACALARSTYQLAALRAWARVGSISLDNSPFIEALGPRLARPFLEGFAGSMTLMFLTGAAVLVFAWVIVVLMPEVPLRHVPGLEAQRSGSAQAEPASPNAVPPVAEPVAEPVLTAARRPAH